MSEEKNVRKNETKEELIWRKEHPHGVISSLAAEDALWLLAQGKVDAFRNQAAATAAAMWQRHALSLLDLKSVSEDGRFLRAGRLSFRNPMNCDRVPMGWVPHRFFACLCGPHIDLFYNAGEFVSDVLEDGREAKEADARASFCERGPEGAREQAT